MQPNGSSGRYSSPLRYPGGKAKVVNYLKLLIVANSYAGMRYVEPYAGGASVALSLLFEGYVSHAHINDLNRGVHAFWETVLNEPDELCSRIMDVPLSMEEWHQQREVYADPNSGQFEVAFASFFLNRTNRSGIISGGVIGGLQQAGTWKIDARFNRSALCRRIEKVAEYKSKITATRLDAVELIRAERQRSDASIIYLDPPYYIKGARLYDNFYTHDDHVRVSEEVRAARAPWIVSYDASPEILDMYSGCDHLRYSLNYSAAKAVQGTEVMFFSPGIIQPDVASPAGISISAFSKVLKALRA